MLTDDAFGIARLQRRFAHRPEFRDEHRNIRVPHDVMGELKFFRDPGTKMLGVQRNYRKLGQGVSSQPSRQIQLNYDPARFPHFRDLAVDRDHGISQ